MFISLTLPPSRPHDTRVLKGVAFGSKDSFTLIQNAGLGPITQARASGGGMKSGLWQQALASVWEAGLLTVNTAEGAALLVAVRA